MQHRLRKIAARIPVGALMVLAAAAAARPGRLPMPGPSGRI